MISAAPKLLGRINNTWRSPADRIALFPCCENRAGLTGAPRLFHERVGLVENVLARTVFDRRPVNMRDFGPALTAPPGAGASTDISGPPTTSCLPVPISQASDTTFMLAIRLLRTILNETLLSRLNPVAGVRTSLVWRGTKPPRQPLPCCPGTPSGPLEGRLIMSRSRRCRSPLSFC